MRSGSGQRETTSHRYINNTNTMSKFQCYIHVFILFYFIFLILLLNIHFTALGCAPDGEPMPGGEPVPGGEPPVPPGLCS